MRGSGRLATPFSFVFFANTVKSRSFYRGYFLTGIVTSGTI